MALLSSIVVPRKKKVLYIKNKCPDQILLEWKNLKRGSGDE